MTEMTSIIPDLPDSSGEAGIDNMLNDLMKKLESSDDKHSKSDSSWWPNNILFNGIIISLVLLFISFFLLKQTKSHSLSVF